jgi:hypothetical protein
MRCKNCIHWERNDEILGNCDCKCFGEGEDFKKLPDNGIIHWACYGDGSGIYVGQNFGCIHFEVKK